MKPEIRKYIEEEFSSACRFCEDKKPFIVVKITEACLDAFYHAEAMSLEERLEANHDLHEWYGAKINEMFAKLTGVV